MKLLRKEKSSIQSRLAAVGFDGNRRYKSIGSALESARTVFSLEGFTLLDEVANTDGTDLFGLESGRICFPIAFETREEDVPFTEYFQFIWTKLENGYEIIGYLS